MIRLPSDIEKFRYPNITERISWIDNLKGIAMILVLLSHMSLPIEISAWFTPFFLSLFCVVSGYTFNIKNDFCGFLKNKIRTLLIPAFLLGIIQIIISEILTFSKQKPFIIQIKELIIQNGGQGSKMWFVFFLFVSCVPFYFIVKYIRATYIFILVNMFFGGICLIYNYCEGGSLPWYINIIGIGCFWMSIGYLWRIGDQYTTKIEIDENSVFHWALYTCGVGVYIGLIIIQLFVLKPGISVSLRKFEAPVWLYLFETILGTILLFSLIKNIPSIRFLEFIGKNTLVFFAFHGKIQRISEIVLVKLNIMGWKQWLIILITQCFLCAVISIIVNDFFPFLVGKRKEKYDN